MHFLRSVKGCTKRDKIKNNEIKKGLRIFSMKKRQSNIIKKLKNVNNRKSQLTGRHS